MPPDASPPPTPDDILRIAKNALARRAASRHQLRLSLLRKIGRRRGSVDEAAMDTGIDALVDAVLDRLDRGGLFDDAGLAASRAAGFAAQGLPAARIRETLAQQGLDTTHEDVEARIEPDDAVQARRFAERKRLGPFGSGRREPSRERDVRAMVRAGFSPRVAFRVLAELDLGHDGASPIPSIADE